MAMENSNIAAESEAKNSSFYKAVLPSSVDLYYKNEETIANATGDGNQTSMEYPAELKNVNMTNLISYSILFPFAAVGNLLVFGQLFKSRHRKSRVNLMLLHLTIADMIVAFIFLPTEIIWHINIEWIFGTTGCKIYKFLSAFGFYISSMVLVCISLDRYFAVLHPLKVNDAQRRGKIMLSFAWLISAVISIPQSVIFNVQQHPEFPSFHQCVSFGFFDQNEEMVYTVFVISFLYLFPLAIIVVAYSTIILEITKKSKESRSDQQGGGGPGTDDRKVLRLRRSNMSTIERARSRTLGMTFIIVVAFVWCWTPYSICTLWNFIDQDTFRRVNVHVQDVLFILAVSNSVVNPIIYGRYTVSCFGKRQQYRKSPVHNTFQPDRFCYLCCCFCCIPPATMASARKTLKHCSGSIITTETAHNNRSLFRTNQRNVLTQIKLRTTLINANRPELGMAPELISMMPLRNKSPRNSDIESQVSTPRRPCYRGFSSGLDTDPSSGYSSTQGQAQCQSFQELQESERLKTVWESHHSY